MRIKVLESIAIFAWLAIVFYWANYANIPKGTVVYLIKTLPLLLLGIGVIEFFFRKYKQKK
jgi:hypothetical protein